MVTKQPDNSKPDDLITQAIKIKTLNRLADIPIIGKLSFDNAIDELITAYLKNKE